MLLQNCHISCGVQQVYGLDVGYRGDYLKQLLTLLSESYAPSMAMIVFSDADMNANGERLHDEIVKEGLGDDGRLVHTTSINPNSDNTITTYVWAPDWKAVAAWMDKQKHGPNEGARTFTKARVQKIEWNFRDEPDDDNWTEDEADEY